MAERTVAGLLSGNGSYVENRPSKWDRTLGILAPYVTEPWNYMTDLMTTPTYYLMGGGTQDDQDALAGRSFNVAAAVTGGSTLVPKPANSVGIFGGRLAATADKNALAAAEKMATDGSPPSEIWDKTGWFQGADGQWRFEIPDDKTLFRGLQPPDRPPGDTVGRQLMHGDLYAAYPETADVGVNFLRSAEPKSGQLKGLYNGEDITLFGSKDAKSTLLHEMQHDIQRREGFAPGGNTFALKKGTPAWDIYQERRAAMAKPVDVETFQKLAGFDTLEAAQKAYPGYVKQLKKPSGVADKAAQQYAVEQAYLRSAGEVEARNVQKRMDMSPEQRKASPPWETQDYPDDMQFVTRRDEAKSGLPRLQATLKKYGLAGLLGSSAAYNAMSDQPQREY